MTSENTIIHIENLVKRFDKTVAVNDISFDVARGERFAFLGPNGAGKTTTIKILTTLLHRDGGTVEVNGFDPAHQADQVRHSFGIVFQDQSTDDDLTAYENMDFHARLYGISKSERQERIQMLMEYVDLWKRKDSLVKEFSGGMKRRLEIARGLIHHPKILFLDEPTLGLDPQTRNYIWEYIHTLSQNEGMTVFFTTHYMEEAERHADRIAVIDEGRVVAIGSPKELKEQTQTQSVEEAFLTLTGKVVREETAGATDRLRAFRRR